MSICKFKGIQTKSCKIFSPPLKILKGTFETSPTKVGKKTTKKLPFLPPHGYDGYCHGTRTSQDKIHEGWRSVDSYGGGGWLLQFLVPKTEWVRVRGWQGKDVRIDLNICRGSRTSRKYFKGKDRKQMVSLIEQVWNLKRWQRQNLKQSLGII